MKNKCFSCALAFSSVLSAGAAVAQGLPITIAGALSTARAGYTDIGQIGFKGVLSYSFMLDDLATARIAFPNAFPFADGIFYFSGVVDVSDPSHGVAEDVLFVSRGKNADDIEFRNFGYLGLLEGDEFTLAVSCYQFCFGDMAFSFDVYGLSLLVLGPTPEEELAAALAASGGAGRLIVVGADGVARDAGQVSLSTRDNQISLTRVADGTAAGQVTVSTQDAPGMMGNLYTWIEATGFTSDTFGSGDGTLAGGGLQIGADLAVGANAVAGLSLGYSQVQTSDAGTTTEATYTYLQPYYAYSAGAWSGAASLVYGMAEMEQSSLGGDGTADVTLTALTFEGGYDHDLSNGLTLTPTLGLIHGREELTGTGGTLAGQSSTVSFSQGSLGARLTQTGPNGEFFVGLHADYLTHETESALAADLLASEGWTGRIEWGAETEMANGMGLSTALELSGLGGDMQTVSGALRVALRF